MLHAALITVAHFSAVSEPLALRRSRREKKKSRASDRLEQIRSEVDLTLLHHSTMAALHCRKARETGVVEEELEATEELFSYVTEEEYGQIVQERQRDAWILDDGIY